MRLQFSEMRGQLSKNPISVATAADVIPLMQQFVLKNKSGQRKRGKGKHVIRWLNRLKAF